MGLMNFEFATATRVIFGRGTISELGQHALTLGQTALLVVGKQTDRAQPVMDLLQQAGVRVRVFAVEREPTIALMQAGVQQAQGCDLVISMGGGSVLDAGKAIAALLTNTGDIFDYLEVIGRGKPLHHASIPFIAIPTTAGTGSEVTRNAVLDAPEHQVKVSLRSAAMLPRLALVDPELALSVPPAITASTGMDALTQLIEPFVSNKANPITDALCREGMQRAARSLRRAYQQGDDLNAREDMALAALLSGMALANARLGAVHGFAGPFGGMFGAPHGAICAALLAPVTAMNIQAAQADGDQATIQRYTEVARIITGTPDMQALVDWLAQLAADLHIPKLATYGLTSARFPELIEKSSRTSSMQGNPVKLSAAQLQVILEEAM